MRKSVKKISALEQLSWSMEEDILNYKTMFDKSNNTILIMAENVEEQITSLNGRLEELDVEGMLG